MPGDMPIQGYNLFLVKTFLKCMKSTSKFDICIPEVMIFCLSF